MTEQPTHCRICGKPFTEADDLEPEICNACYPAWSASFPEDILMPQSKEWEQLLDAARGSQTEAAFAAIGRYVLSYLDGFEID